MEHSPTEAAKQSEIQRIVMDYLREIVSSSRDFEEKTGISHTMYGRYNDMTSSMGVDKLEQICSRFPELKSKIGRHLIGDIKQKHTAATNNSEATTQEVKDLVKTLETSIAILDRDNEKLWNLVDRLTAGKPAITDKG